MYVRSGRRADVSVAVIRCTVKRHLRRAQKSRKLSDRASSMRTGYAGGAARAHSWDDNEVDRMTGRHERPRYDDGRCGAGQSSSSPWRGFAIKNEARKSRSLLVHSGCE